MPERCGLRISRIIRHCVFYDTSFYAMQSCEDNFKVPIAFTLKKKESVALKVFHSLSGMISANKM